MPYVKMRKFTRFDEESPAMVTEAESAQASDYKKAYNPHGTMGDAAFSTASRSEDRNILVDKVRSYTRLCVPVVNTILTSGTSPIVSKVLTIRRDGEVKKLSKKDLKDIISGELIYDVDNDDYVLKNDAEPGRYYLFGGEVLEDLVDNLNIQERIIEELESIILKEYFTETDALYNPIRVTYNPNGNGNLLWNYDLEILKTSSKRKLRQESYSEYIKEVYMQDPDTTLACLFKIDKDALKAVYTNKIRILPRGMRPKIDGRNDPMTILYNNVIKANKVLSQVNREQVPRQFADAYKSLQTAVTLLLSASDDDKKSLVGADEKAMKRKSLVEYTATKEGHIRGKMLSKVQDFSGRSVIVADPTLEVDQVSVPEDMLAEMMYYHTDVKADSFKSLQEACDNVHVSINRAPTLHKLSWRGYRPVPTKSNAIGVHPLANDGFNADHDGDQMAVHVPLHDQACKEVEHLMSVYANMYVPASGGITVKPKQEILYGLWIISRSDYDKPSNNYNCRSESEMVDAFLNQKIKIWDIVTYNNKTQTLGKHIIEYCFPADMVDMCVDIKKSNMEKIMQKLCAKPKDVVYTSINRIVKLSYAAATLYPPTLKVFLDEEKATNIMNPFKDFDEKVSHFRENYYNGFDNKETYNSNYTTEFDKIEKIVKDSIVEEVGTDNGFVQLVLCGARGDNDSLRQIFSYKGRIAKSATEAFNTVLTSCFVSQLSDLEQFVTAYGTRKSLIDKTRKPADTGDATRRMVHTTADATIVSDDCGTTEGIDISYDILYAFAEPRGAEDKVKDMIEQYIVGRYIAGTNELITAERAKEIAEELEQDHSKKVTIRSPLTCKDKYCSKCYGVDLSVRRRAIRGLPIGFIAAQSIGEPGTQLAMRNFQKGGVASKADITSDFDKIKNIINLVKVDKKDPYYDPVAWDEGVVHTTKDGDYTIISIGDNDKELKIEGDPVLKEYVKKGEGLSLTQGSLDVGELLQYGGIDAAQRYIVNSIFTIYFNQASVAPIHAEILASEMTRWIVVDHKSNSCQIPIGTILTNQERAKLNQSLYEFKPTILSTQKSPLYGNDFLSGLSFQNFKMVFSSALLFGKEDKLEAAFSRIMMGLPPKSGTYYDTYLHERINMLNTEEAII